MSEKNSNFYSEAIHSREERKAMYMAMEKEVIIDILLNSEDVIHLQNNLHFGSSESGIGHTAVCISMPDNMHVPYIPTDKNPKILIISGQGQGQCGPGMAFAQTHSAQLLQSAKISDECLKTIPLLKNPKPKYVNPRSKKGGSKCNGRK